MSTTIKCNKCGNEIEITEAIRRELEEKVLLETKTKHEEEIEKINQKHEEFAKQKDQEIEKVKQEITKSARQDAIEKVRKEYDVKIETTKEEAETIEKQYKESQEQLSELTKQLRVAKDAGSKFKLEYERKLLEGQDKIKSNAKKEAEEEIELKIAEKDKKLSDAEKQIKELQRKIQQGSQQLQGEVQELLLEELLRKEFPLDEIKEISKGKRGADIKQIIKTQTGLVCGTIYWESKNTTKWSPSWVQKLIEDQRTLKAEIAVLVSKVLPEGINSFGPLDKIWVSDIKSAVYLAYALRQQLIGIQNIREANKGKSTKAEVVYNYLISNEFKQRIEVWVEYFRDRRGEIDKERVYFTKKWEKEEKKILKVFENTAGIYGDLQGLIGNALPKVKYLELPDNLDKSDEKTKND